MDYTVAWRIYFSAFSSAVMRVHVTSGMAPGINAYADWPTLAAKLGMHGPKVFDGDFKAFDASEQPSLHLLILEFINLWYNDGEENARVRRVLWQDLIHSRHLGGMGNDQRHIYQWDKSLPSGHPFTTIVNSMYSLLLIVSAYIDLTGDSVGFWANVYTVTYGDDNVSNISDKVCDTFNQATVAKCLDKLFGVKYTPGNKSTEYTPWTDITRVQFLKRTFVCQDFEWLCPLEPDSFLYVSYWCKNKRLQAAIEIDVLENTLQELSLHPAALWERYAPKIKDLLYKRGQITRVFFSQSEYRTVTLNRADMWY
jgi:hypothetical protein